MEIIIERAYEVLDLKPNFISRKPEQLKAREFISKYLKEKFNTTLGKIGQYLGNRNHATILNNLNSFEYHFETEKEYARDYNSFFEGMTGFVEEKIRLISFGIKTLEVGETISYFDITGELEKENTIGKIVFEYREFDDKKYQYCVGYNDKLHKIFEYRRSLVNVEYY